MMLKHKSTENTIDNNSSFQAKLQKLLADIELQVCELHDKELREWQHRALPLEVVGLCGGNEPCLQCEATSDIVIHVAQSDDHPPPEITVIKDFPPGDWPATSEEAMIESCLSSRHITPLERWEHFTSKLMEREKRSQAQFTFDVRPFWRANMTMLTRASRAKSLPRVRTFTSSFDHASTHGLQGNRCMLHPESTRKMFCSMVSLALVLFDIVMIPLSLSFVLYPEIASWASRIWWTFDLLVSFRSGYCDAEGNFQMGASHCAWVYVKTWLPLDLFVLSADWLAHWIRDFKHPTTLRVVRIFRLARLIRVCKFTGLIFGFGSSVNVINVTFLHHMRMLQYVFTVVVYFHLQACLWYAIGDSEGGWVSRYGWDSRTASSSYLASLNWALMVEGSRAAPPVTLGERAFVLVAFFFSNFLLLWFAARVTFLVIELTDKEAFATEAAYHEYQKRHAMSVRSQVILRAMTRKHGDRQRLKRIAAEETGLMSCFPMRYQAFLRVEARSPLLHCSPFMEYMVSFSPIHACAEKICAEGMNEELVFSGDQAFHEGHVCSKMNIVEVGALMYTLGEYYRKKQMEHGVLPWIFSKYDSVGSRSQSKGGGTILRQGDCLCEAILWTLWRYRGELVAQRNSSLLNVEPDEFCRILQGYTDICEIAVQHARRCVHELNQNTYVYSDLNTFAIGKTGDLDISNTSVHKHLMFLSHFKLEAGTEATLMMQDLTHMIKQDLFHPACSCEVPVFVDSEALEDLKVLEDHVRRSQYLVVLLTPGILSRPWCLVEIVTAFRNKIELRPIEIQRRGISFEYPDESFYARIRQGTALNAYDTQILSSAGMQPHEIEESIRALFEKISKPYSPHKSANVRTAELEDLLRRCPWRPEVNVTSTKTTGEPRASTKTKKKSFIHAISQTGSNDFLKRRSARSGT